MSRTFRVGPSEIWRDLKHVILQLEGRNLHFSPFTFLDFATLQF